MLTKFRRDIAIIRTSKDPSLFKRGLPVFVPGYDYSDLSIGEGETASATYVDIVEGRVDDFDLEEVQSDLLEYCKRDTEAMVLIWQRLV